MKEMNRNETFDKMAMLYDKVRPSYPKELIEDIIKETKISTGARLLEVGAGTGKATIPFAKNGFQIDCIEMGENLAGLLANKCQKYSNVKVNVSKYEDWKPSNQLYDLIYSAQAFHWMDKNIKYQKSYDLLKKDGSLALFWYQNENESTEVMDELKTMTKKIVPDFYDNEVDRESLLENREIRIKELQESGIFTYPSVKEYVLNNVMDVEGYIQSVRTYSKYRILDESIKRRLLEEIRNVMNHFGGKIRTKIVYSLFLAKKLGD